VFGFPEEARNFLYCKLPGLSLGPIVFPIYWVKTVLSAGVKLARQAIYYFYRVSRLRMRGDMPSFLHISSWLVQGQLRQLPTKLTEGYSAYAAP